MKALFPVLCVAFIDPQTVPIKQGEIRALRLGFWSKQIGAERTQALRRMRCRLGEIGNGPLSQIRSRAALLVSLASSLLLVESPAQSMDVDLVISTLSDKATVSLLTVSPGDSLHTTFGHCSIRIEDDPLGIDAVYHWGLAAPSLAGFYFGGVRENEFGILLRSTWDNYVEALRRSNRVVRESVLNLNAAEKQQVFERLLHRYSGPQGRYNYQAFQSNCSTQLFDFLYSVVGDSIVFRPPLDEEIDESYFKLIQPYLERKPWVRLALNSTFGTAAHRPITYRQTSFLPDGLERLLRNSQLVRNGRAVSWVGEAEVIVEGEGEPHSGIRIGPFPILLGVMLCAFVVSSKRSNAGIFAMRFDRALFGIVAIASVGLFLVTILVSHPYSGINYNLFWLLPFHVVPLINRANVQFKRIYFRIWSLVFASVLFFYWLYLNPLFSQLWPLIIALVLRSACLSAELPPLHKASRQY